MTLQVGVPSRAKPASLVDLAPAEKPAAPLGLPDKPSIAVLPFQNMSGDPEQEYFGDGICEDIITMLSRSPSLFVIARNSGFTYKGRAVDVKQIALSLCTRPHRPPGWRSGDALHALWPRLHSGIGSEAVYASEQRAPRALTSGAHSVRHFKNGAGPPVPVPTSALAGDSRPSTVTL